MGWGGVGVIAHTARLAVCQQTSYPRAENYHRVSRARHLPAPEARDKYTHMHAVSLPNESMFTDVRCRIRGVTGRLC